MAYKYNFYLAMIFEKEELDHRGTQVILRLQFCTDRKTASTIYLEKIQDLTPGTILLRSFVNSTRNNYFLVALS